LGVEALIEGQSDDGTEFWGPVTTWAPNWGAWSTTDPDLRSSKYELIVDGRELMRISLSYAHVLF